MLRLRNKPCISGCDYCNSVLNIQKGLKRYFGFDAYRSYGGEPLQEKAEAAGCGGVTTTCFFEKDMEIYHRSDPETPTASGSEPPAFSSPQVPTVISSADRRIAQECHGINCIAEYRCFLWRRLRGIHTVSPGSRDSAAGSTS